MKRKNGEWVHLMLQQLYNRGSGGRIPNQAALDERGQHLVLLLQRRERDLVFVVCYCLQFHQRVLDVPKGHLAIGEVVQDASQTPNVTLEADFDAGLSRSRGIQVLDRFWRHEVEGAHLVVDHHAGLVRHHR